MWDVMIGLGVAMALQPLPPLASIVLLSVERGVRKAFAFFLGEFAAMFVVGAVAVALEVGTARDSASRAASVVTLAAGVFLLVLGLRYLVRSRRSDGVAEPSWLGRLDRMEPWPAFLLGAFLPTYVIAVAAGAHVVEAQPGTSAAVAAMLVFLAVGTSTVYAPIVVAHVAPERSGPARARVRDWLVRNWVGVGGAVLLLVGGYLVGKGTVGLS